MEWHELRQTGVVRRLKSRDGWAKAWNADMARPVSVHTAALTRFSADWPTRIPAAPDLGLPHDPCPLRQPGGRQQGLQTLHGFLGKRGRDYRFQMSSPVTAFDASLRLSPDIA